MKEGLHACPRQRGTCRSCRQGTLSQRAIVAGNTATTGGHDLYNDGGTVNATGVNLLNALTDSGLTAGASVLVGTPDLAALGDYGGPTQTMPPLPGSPAIDPAGGDTNSVFSTDQRGLPRPVNGIVDIGAVEVQLIIATDPPVLTNLTVLGDGTYQFAFTNLAGASFSVFATTNVSHPITNWTSIGPAIETPPGSGQFQFTDPDATNYNQRFYSVKSP